MRSYLPFGLFLLGATGQWIYNLSTGTAPAGWWGVLGVGVIAGTAGLIAAAYSGLREFLYGFLLFTATLLGTRELRFFFQSYPDSSEKLWGPFLWVGIMVPFVGLIWGGFILASIMPRPHRSGPQTAQPRPASRKPRWDRKSLPKRAAADSKRR